MREMCSRRTTATLVMALAVVVVVQGLAIARQTDDTPNAEERKTVEPVFRVSKLPANVNEAEKSAIEAEIAAEEMSAPPVARVAEANAPHPLDDALEIAFEGLEHMRANIHDYTAVLVKRERVDNQLGEPQYMSLKIRNERDTDEVSQPFSVYMKFLKPRAQAGREVIWVKGRNANKLLAHEGGLLGVKTFHLDPDGWLAMKGQRYPIYDAGIENLILKLIEKAERDRAAGICEVVKRPNANINNRPCTMIEVTHPDRESPYEFYKAQVFIDNELQVPVRYAAYDWPQPGQKPELLEEYTYINLNINVGLTDADFDPANNQYRFR